MHNFDQYLSPFSWRYGSPEMRALWSEIEKLKTWRSIWVSLAQVQHELGFVTEEQLSDLRKNAENIDIERTQEIERETRHDVMAEIKCFAEQAPIGGRILHLGATSTDVKDNTYALLMKRALGILLPKLALVLKELADKMEAYADFPIVAFTHLQPAEPSTLGYRFAVYAQDLFEDWQQLTALQHSLRAKGFKGAVGTSASYIEVLGKENLPQFDRRMSELLDIEFYEVSTQTYPRKQDFQVLSALAGLGASLYKFAFDLRLLQSPVIFEWSEPFGKKQIGSSAMPFKKNPINAEKIDSLARQLAKYPQVAWDNAAHSLLERTLDDSANRRIILPESFLICDEILETSLKILTGLQIHEEQIKRNFNQYAVFAGVEKVLMAAVKRGGSRQEVHETLRKNSVAAWEEMQNGKPNPLRSYLTADPDLQKHLTTDEIEQLLEPADYVGMAPDKAKKLAKEIKFTLDNQED